MPNDDHGESRMLSQHYVAALLAAMACFGLFQAHSVRTNADVAWYLYAGGQILDGARLGEDIVEVNAPLIIVLSMGVEALARLLGCTAIALLPGLVTALSCASLAACAHIARPWPASIRQPFLIGLAFVLFIDIGGMVGQREHLLVIFIMPYVCSLARLTDSEPMAMRNAVPVGGAAALGFALKPFFVPAWLALEAYMAYRRGPREWFRPQSVAMFIMCLLYAIGVAWWTPDYFTFAAESLLLYRAYQPYGDVPILLSSSFVFVLTAIILAYCGVRPFARSIVEVCAIVALMLSAAVFLQDKGWHYQWYPATSLATILLAVTIGVFGASSRYVTPAGAQGIVALVVVLLAVRTCSFWTIDPPERQGLEALVRRHAHDGAILSLSSHLHVGFPLVNETKVRWASRYPTMWQLPAFCERATTTEFQSQEQQFRDAVLADLLTAHPALLIVDTVPPAPALTEFDYLDYFERDPRLAAALAEYRFLREVGRYRIFGRSNLACGD